IERGDPGLQGKACCGPWLWRVLRDGLPPGTATGRAGAPCNEADARYFSKLAAIQLRGFTRLLL
ncbi:MAG TPA: hypothetical protein DD732_06490, partial [Rhizobiales bacterium]|nr:hypothetical protein [Hyphomicrobiales bacterium]